MLINNYETLLILTPALSNEERKDVMATFVKELKEQGAKVIHKESWEPKKLAYPIKKNDYGLYEVIEFKASGDVVARMETDYKRDERVIRFLTIKLDKHGIAYNEQKRIANANAKTTKQEGI